MGFNLEEGGFTAPLANAPRRCFIGEQMHLLARLRLQAF
jgi:hypothetical protein